MLLRKILHKKQEELANESYLYDIAELARARNTTKTARFRDILTKQGIAHIGCIQGNAPSAVNTLIKSYSQSMDAISVTTETDFFRGSIDDIRRCRALTDLPLMQIDFFVSPLSIFKAKNLGASAVLFVADVLTEGELREYLRLARGLHMDGVVSVEKKEDVHLALRCGADILAMSCRKPGDNRFHAAKIGYLSSFMPEDVLRVCLSSARSQYEYDALEAFHLNAVMVEPCFLPLSKTAPASQ